MKHTIVEKGGGEKSVQGACFARLRGRARQKWCYFRHLIKQYAHLQLHYDAVQCDEVGGGNAGGAGDRSAKYHWDTCRFVV